MSTSTAKIAANRANAIRSTGPADTSRSRFNGLAHGLTSTQTVIRGESQAEYDTFQAQLRADLQPRSAMETLLADRVIAAAWRLKRFTRVENAFFDNRIDAILEADPATAPDAALATLFTDPAEMARMRLFMRYQTGVQREYDKAFKEFQSVKADRESHEEESETTQSHERKAASYQDFGFASQPAPETVAAVAAAGSTAQYFAAESVVLK